MSVKENLKPVPSCPHYLFNFKDIVKVLQGLQLLASKSKVLPAKATKKCILNICNFASYLKFSYKIAVFFYKSQRYRSICESDSNYCQIILP